MDIIARVLVILTLCLAVAHAKACTSDKDCPNKSYICDDSNTCDCKFGNITSFCRECKEDSDCPTYARCASSSICLCKYGGTIREDNILLPTCDECYADDHCNDKYAKCDKDKCVCKYGGSKIGSCYECSSDSDCSNQPSTCGNHTCTCQYGTYFGSCKECQEDGDCQESFSECSSSYKCKCTYGDKIFSRCKECSTSSDCSATFSQCDILDQCSCVFGGEVRSNGKLTTCSAIVGIISGVSVAVVVLAIVTAYFCVRSKKRRSQQATQAAAYAQTLGADQAIPVPAQSYHSTYPAQQYLPVAPNQGHVNQGYYQNQPPSAPYTPEANK